MGILYEMGRNQNKEPNAQCWTCGKVRLETNRTVDVNRTVRHGVGGVVMFRPLPFSLPLSGVNTAKAKSIRITMYLVLRLVDYTVSDKHIYW